MQSNFSSLAYAPELLYPAENESRILELKTDSNVVQLDRLHKQLAEYVKLSRPDKNLSTNEIESEIRVHFPDIDAISLYVYYPWKSTLVRIVEESLFKAIRTNRNKLKITTEEQEKFEQSKIGVVGLSVGNAVATTLAMERVGGTLVLADYDELEVSILNRLRAGLCDLDLPKNIIAARQIAEIDHFTFIKVVLFSDGITNSNIDSFLNTAGGLDTLSDYSSLRAEDTGPESFDIEQSVKAIIERCKARNADSGVRFNSKVVCEGDTEVLFKRKKTELLLRKLIENAFLFRNEGSTSHDVFVSIRHTLEVLVVEVTDSRQGILPNSIEDIFGLFYRGSNQSEGVGMGLYIARELVREFDGSISVNSNPGEGSTFKVELPINRNGK